MRSPKLTPYLGPVVFLPHDIKESNIDSYEHEVISALIQQIPDAKVWHLALPPGIQQAGIFRQHQLATQVQQTFMLNLADDETTLLANMKDTLRRNIRQGEKEVMISNAPEHIDDLFRFHEQTLGNKGRKLAYTLSDFKQLMDACIAHDAGALWVAKEGNTLHAIVWHVWDHRFGYCFMAAQNPASTNYKAMSAILWQAIKYSKERNHRFFDLEGSMDEGVERFYRTFGGKRALYMILLRNRSLLWRIKKQLLG